MSLLRSVHRIAVLTTFTVGFFALAAVLALFGDAMLSECWLARCRPRSQADIVLGWTFVLAAAVSLTAPLAVAALWGKRWLLGAALAIAVATVATAAVVL